MDNTGNVSFNDVEGSQRCCLSEYFEFHAPWFIVTFIPPASPKPTYIRSFASCLSVHESVVLPHPCATAPVQCQCCQRLGQGWFQGLPNNGTRFWQASHTIPILQGIPTGMDRSSMAVGVPLLQVSWIFLLKAAGTSRKTASRSWPSSSLSRPRVFFKTREKTLVRILIYYIYIYIFISCIHILFLRQEAIAPPIPSKVVHLGSVDS